MEMSMTQVRRLVSKKELKTLHGIPYSFAHIARLEKAKLFPKRLILGACRVAWWEDEIEEWKTSRPRAA
jgi:prophage regulatory protein